MFISFLSYLSYPKLLLQTMFCLCGEWGHGCAVLCSAHHDVWPNCSALETCVCCSCGSLSCSSFFSWLSSSSLVQMYCLLGVIADVSTIRGGALGGLVIHPCYWVPCPHWVFINHPGWFCIFFSLVFLDKRMVCYTIHFSSELLKQEMRILGSNPTSMAK